MKKKEQNSVASLIQFVGLTKFRLDDVNAISLEVRKAMETVSREMYRQHGFRVESMFAYVAAALGKCKLIKQEDGSGLCLLIDEGMKIPDYRVALDDSTIFFVEVKNCAGRKISFRKNYIDRLNEYTLINNASLKVAIYWSSFKIWTLISIERFDFEDDKYELKMNDAMMLSEMAVLGDRMIATQAPLKISFIADPEKTSFLDKDGQCQFTIGSIELHSKDTLIADPIESNIAFWLMLSVLSKTWHESEEVIIDNEKITSIEYSYAPIEADIGQSFSLIDFLSRIISIKYDSSTIADGKIERFLPTDGPEQFKIFIPENYKGKYLPIWQFIIKPNEHYKNVKNLR